MNKSLIITIIVLFSIVYIAFDKFILSTDSVVDEANTEISSDFSVIKPPTISVPSNDVTVSDGIYAEKNSENNQSDSPEKELVNRLTSRQTLLDLHKNKKLTYTSLGEMIEKMQAQKSNSTAVKDHLTRVQYNLELAKKIASLTKKLHKDVDGNKVFDQDVFNQLQEVQKQILVPNLFVESNNESGNAN